VKSTIKMKTLVTVLFISGFVASSALATTHAKTKAKAPVVKSVNLPEEENSEETMSSSLVAGESSIADTNAVTTVGDEITTAPAAIMPTNMEGDQASAPTSAFGATDAASISATAVTAATTTNPAKLDTTKLSEDQIPVLANTKEEKKSSGSPWQRILATLGVLVLVFFGLSIGLKRWMTKRNSSNQNTRIRVLTQHHVGPKKSLMIVQVAGESILIGVTDTNISMIKSLALIDDEIPEEMPNNFNRALTGIDEFQDEEMETQPAIRAGRAPKAIASRDADVEDFAMRGISEIRDVVSSRLKNMKSF
jgi:flagellar protein FliO/FliZ